MAKTLSVALATYNGEAFLAEQLESIAAQTRRPDELVVRDDGSTDGTLGVLSAFAPRAPFPVRLLPGGERLGYARNFGEVLSHCAGDYIALCDQDDVWLPHKVERVVGALEADAAAVLAFSDLALVDEALRPLGRTMWEGLALGPEKLARFGGGWRVSPLIADYFVTGAAACFHRSLLPLALPLVLPGYHDAWLALLAAFIGRVVPVAEPLVLYRQHGGNQIGAPRREGFREAMERRARRWGEGDRVVGELNARREALVRAVRDRLDERGLLAPEQRGILDAVIAHHAFRARIPPYPARAAGIARELAWGRYHELAGGLRPAFRDALRRPFLAPPPATPHSR